jgi:hypothetical protein
MTTEEIEWLTDARGNRCSVENCDRPAKARGWCNKHWYRWRAHGDPQWRPDQTGFDTLRILTATPPQDCILWPGFKDPNGYGRVWFKGGYRLSHRVSYQINVDEIPAHIDVCHSCDTPSCVNPHHLFLGTAADNLRDCKQKGRNAHGVKSGRAKLAESDVRAIRIDPRPTRVIAKQFGIASSGVSGIKRRKLWSHIV